MISHCIENTLSSLQFINMKYQNFLLIGAILIISLSSDFKLKYLFIGVFNIQNLIFLKDRFLYLLKHFHQILKYKREVV